MCCPQETRDSRCQHNVHRCHHFPCPHSTLSPPSSTTCSGQYWNTFAVVDRPSCCRCDCLYKRQRPSLTKSSIHNNLSRFGAGVGLIPPCSPRSLKNRVAGREGLLPNPQPSSHHFGNIKGTFFYPPPSQNASPAMREVRLPLEAQK